MQLLTGATLAALSDEQVESLNQYLYRFIKLQDAMGVRLFAQTLTLLAENVRGMPFIDQLSLLRAARRIGICAALAGIAPVAQSANP